MALRNIPTDLQEVFSDNIPFTYAHLIKFERPSKVSQYLGISSTDAKNYTYITDAPYDIVYNDGTGNGPQVYRANKLLKVGSINETVKAKASNITVQLDSSTMDSQAIEPRFITLSTTKGGTGTLNATGATNFVELGFREGDKATIRSSNGGFDGVSVIIRTFINEGNGFTYTAATTMPAISLSASADVTSIDLVSEELTALTSGKNTTDYSNYINRDVIVHKVFIATEYTSLANNNYNAGQIFGGLGTNTNPQGGLLLFRGLISSVALQDGPKKSTITWTAASHWADFNRIQGRRTEDTSHRAVSSEGVPDRNSAIREAYADDLGFVHASTSVNLTAVYDRTETKTEVDVDKNWYGGVDDVSTYEVEYDVPTELDLKFNLQAKYIPVVYGVHRVDTIPVFVDTRNHNSSEIHMTYAIAEGTVTGLYDIHLDGTSSICTDKSDFDVRGTEVSAQDDDGVINFICRGRQDKGDVLGGYVSSNTALQALQASDAMNESQFSQNQDILPAVPLQEDYYSPDFSMLNSPISNTGILHGKTVSYDNPLSTHITFHQGTAYQRANDRLVEIAQSTAVDTETGLKTNFKIQNDYYTRKEEYYGPNHRLLDTSYLHAQYTIADNQTTLPKFKTVVKGKAIKCYNYDNTYSQDTRPIYNSDNHTNFGLGNVVELRATSSGNPLVSGSFRIVDKWFFYDTEGIPQYRFRLKNTTTGEEPTIPETASFFMQRGTLRWYMNTHTESSASLVDSSIVSSLSSSISSRGTGTLTLSSPSAAVQAALSLSGVIVKLRSSKTSQFLAANFSNVINNSNVLTNVGTTTWDSSITKVIIGNGIILPGTASETDNMYIGAKVIFTRTLADGTTYVQERNIIDYHGLQKVAIVDAPWDSKYIPGYTSYDTSAQGSDTVTLLIGEDERPSTNPAMQLLDYLKSKRYGKGLQDSDIDLDSFISAAKACDIQSDVTVVALTANISGLANGDEYSYGSVGSSRNYFRGTVSSTFTKSIDSTSYTQVTFTDVIGKLGYKWNDYTPWAVGDLIWNPADGLLKTASSSAAISGEFLGTSQNGLNLTKESGSGPSTLPLDVTIFKAGNNNPVVKGYTPNFNTFVGSGYSLYDADDIKYWKYIGWDEPTQRNATRHQMNQSINTSQPLFGNVNKMLEQFNGVLRYSLGKYQLTIRSKKGTVSALEKISQGDIIGDIKITDKGSKSTYNSANLSFPDPHNLFENRDLAFFNSDYLKQDKGIPKNLSYQVRGITNYFNARFNLVQKLKESRSGTNINFKIGPRGYALLPGEIIQISYDRFGWEQKDFRISSINYSNDCLATITAREHDDNAFVVESTQQSLDSKFEVGGLPIKPIPDSPTNLAASSPSAGGIGLTWLNSASFGPITHTVQIWRSDSNSRSVTKILTANSTPKAGTEHTNVVVASSAGVVVGQLVKYRGATTPVLVESINGNTITLDQKVEILDGTYLVFYTATLIAEVKEQVEYIDPVISADNSVTRYYWVRYRVTESGNNNTTERFSPFFPTSTTGGVSGTSQPSGSPRSVKVFAGGSGISGNVITYDVDLANPSPSQITFSAIHQGTSAESNVAYEWFEATPGGSFSSIGTDSASHQATMPTAFSGLPKLFKCKITDTVGTATYTAEDVLEVYGTHVGADGEATQGDPGVSTATVYAYVRSSAANFTAKPSGITWTFLSGTGSSFTQNSGVTYSYTVPSGTGPLYICSVIASGTSATDSIATSDWSAPQLMSENGANTATVYAYQRSSTALAASAKPTNTRTWTFATGLWSIDNDLGNGFSGVVPGGSDDLYTCTAIATSLTATDSVAPADWSAPQLLGKGGADAFYVVSRLPSFGFSADSTGEINTLTGFQNTFTVREGTQEYTFDSSAPYAANSYRYGTFTSSQTGGVDDITITTAADGTIGINTTGTPFKSGTSILDAHFDQQILNNNGNAVIATMRSSLTKSVPVGGTPAKTVSLRASKQVIDYTAAGTHANNQTITLTAETQNFTTAYFKFTGNGISDEATWTTGDSANLDTFSFPIPTTYSATPYVITVSVKESGNTGAVIATDTLTISSLKPSTDGDPGESFKTVSVYKIGDNTLGFSSGGASGQTFASPVNNLETDWSTTQPSITANNQTVYQATRTFSTITANSDAAWSTPVIVASRIDGTSTTGQSVKTVSLFRKSNADAPTTAGTFADPDNGVNVNWLDNQPALASNGDIVYQITRTFTSDAAAPQDSAWSTPVIVASKTDGLSSAQQVDRFLGSRKGVAADITFSTLNNAVKLLDASQSDQECGMVLPAKTVVAGQKWNVSFAYKADSNTSDGLYARINSDTAVLSGGNTAVASGLNHVTGVEDVNNTSSAVPGWKNGSVLSDSAVTTSWQVRTFVYTVPADAVVAGLQIFKYSTMATSNALYIKDVEFSLQGAAGTDGFTVVLSNETHALPASNSGAVSSFAGSGTTISVFEGTTQLAYDTTPTADGQFKVTSAHSGMSAPSIADGGNTAVVANFTAMAGDTGSATYTITGLTTDGSALPTIVKTQTFTKSKAGSDSTAAGSRGPGRFVIEESTAGTNTTGADAAAFAASSFTNDFTSGRIAADIIALASDSKIQSGDIVTVTDNSANVSGTRIYDGNPTATSGNVDADDFSSLVVETIQGSAIVDGTLSAASIQSGTVTANDFKVGSSLQIGDTNTPGSIHSIGKTNATDTTNGFFLGVDEDGDAEFAIGGGGDNSTLMNQDGIVVKDGSGTIRVALGNLSNLLP